jgi:hypothetical protein
MVGSAGFYWVAWVRKKRPRRAGRCGKIGVMAGAARLESWPARRRDGAVPLFRHRPGTGGWFATSRQTRVRVCAQKHRRGNCGECATFTAGGRRVARWRGWSGPRRREAARAWTRKGARARVRPGTRSARRKDTTEGGASARHSGTPASLARVRIQKEKGSGFLPSLATCARVHGRVDECEGACKKGHVEHTDVRTAAAA